MNERPAKAGHPVIEIERLVPGGAGLGRLADGRAALVPGGLPGDRLRLLEIRDKKSFVQAKGFELVEAGPGRTVPACPVVATCGGCDWMALSPSAQLDAKKSLILQELREPIRIEPSPRSTHYRSRVRLQVGGGRVGFFARESHQLVEIEECLVSSEKLWKAVSLVRGVVRAHPAVFDAARHVEVRVFGSAEGPELGPEHCSAHFVFAEGVAEELSQKEALRRATLEIAPFMQVRCGNDPAQGQTYEPHPGVLVLSAPGGFTQVNEEVNRILVGRVLQEASRVGAQTFLDLYCGSGNFALPLLSRGLSGVGVELAREAIGGARAAAAAQGWSGEFFAEASESYVRRATASGQRFDMVVVDPPRAGAKALVSSLLGLLSPLLLMVSCDPVTLARDLRLLVDGGYKLRSVEGFDMFPQTHHVESLAVLER
jgi:23S rRNA (uracil1939-C5)-methyltransferase